MVADPDRRDTAAALLARAGYDPEPAEEPYSAMLALARRPGAYRAVALSLPGLHRPELNLLSAVARRLGHVERWVCHADGHSGLLAEAMRLGATALLDEAGLHPLAAPPPAQHPRPDPPPALVGGLIDDPDDGVTLSADELRALLDDG